MALRLQYATITDFHLVRIIRLRLWWDTTLIKTLSKIGLARKIDLDLARLRVRELECENAQILLDWENRVAEPLIIVMPR